MIADLCTDSGETPDDMAMVHMNVRCTHCGNEALRTYPALVVFVALTRWKQMALHCECRSDSYSASPLQLDSIREQVGPDWIAEHIRLKAAQEVR